MRVEFNAMKNPDFDAIALPSSCPAVIDEGRRPVLFVDQPDSEQPAPDLAKLAKVLYASRAKRRRFLTGELLSEPAWDILLDLYANHAEGRSLRTTSVCLAFSALYELFEWGTAMATGEAAADFLGTQGDVWDTQWDMFLALLGAVAAQALLARRHDGELAEPKS